MPEFQYMPKFQYPSNCVEILPDAHGNRYRFPFSVRSDSNPDKTYTISYDNAPGSGHWTCSCRGNIFHGHCSHLLAAGLCGRKFGKSPFPGSEQATVRNPDRANDRAGLPPIVDRGSAARTVYQVGDRTFSTMRKAHAKRMAEAKAARRAPSIVSKPALRQKPDVVADIAETARKATEREDEQRQREAEKAFAAEVTDDVLGMLKA